MMHLNGNGMVKTVETGKDAILAADPAPYAVMRAATESLSRAVLFRAHCEVLNEAIMRYVELCYELDSAERWVNIDRTGMVLRPAPWGRLGQRAWGLRRTEANVLRAMMQSHVARHDKGREPALFLYGENRRWYVNLVDFPSERAAMDWARSHQVTVANWRYHTEDK